MERTRPRTPWWVWLALPVVLPLAALAAALWLLLACALIAIVWTTWHPRGRFALVVYSNSPIWQQYFEREVLPEAGPRAAVLNWSERSRWTSSSPSVLLFHVFGGSREFNPVAIVFPRWRWPRRFAFFGAFKAFKHGEPGEVEALRRDFLDALARASEGRR